MTTTVEDIKIMLIPFEDGDVWSVRLCRTVTSPSTKRLFFRLTLLKLALSALSTACYYFDGDEEEISFFYNDKSMPVIFDQSMIIFTAAIAFSNMTSVYFLAPLTWYTLIDFIFTLYAALYVVFTQQRYVIPFIGEDSLIFVICVSASIFFKFYYLILLLTIKHEDNSALYVDKTGPYKMEKERCMKKNK